IDCEDDDCATAAGCFEDCTNGVDDDGDEDIDCDDADCANDAACRPAPVAFTFEELQARFDVDCRGCHVFLRNDFRVQTINVRGGGTNLDRIEPGDHTRSYIYHKLAGTQATVGGAGVRMPRGGPFWSVDDLARFAAYIDALPVQ
ncbi:MAG: hypothetical protein KC620_22370, partial [Myxococcales bacterium]|nr:hypothetical protein [Myxococcales bacterium]